jgi:hypothetical protein
MPADRASSRKRIREHAWLGILTHVVSRDLAGEAVRAAAEAARDLPPERRPRARILTPQVTLYFVLGLCLFTGTGYAGVFGQVAAGLGVLAPATTTLARARERLGEGPVKALFFLLCTPLACARSAWSHVGGLLVVAWDGTGIDLADTAENAKAFGRPGSRRNGVPPPPMARVVILLACGTRAVLGAAAGPFCGKGTGERELARRLLPCLHAGMLLIADKGFYSYDLWNQARATGAHLLWRVRKGTPLAFRAELPDGSRLAHVDDPDEVQKRLHKNGHRRRRGSRLGPDTSPLPGGMTVRVIEFRLTIVLDDGTSRREHYVLLTDLLDHAAFPAQQLAAAYARRWAVETGWREVKTYLRGSGKALRGKTPALAYQEIWALLAVYQALRILIIRAAAGTGLNPARLSFTVALDLARHSAEPARGRLDDALGEADARLRAALVPEREHRVCPRTLKRNTYSRYQGRKHDPQAPVSHRADCTIDLSPPNQTTRTLHGQHKQATPRGKPRTLSS